MLEPLHPLLRQAFDPERFLRLGEQVLQDTFKHLQDSQGRTREKSMPWTPPEDEKSFWEARLDAPEGLVDLLRLVADRSNGLQDPRYMGHQVAVPFPDGALVGLVTDLLNNGGAIYEMGPTNSAMEEVLMARIGQMMGLPAGCGGILCHGGTLANLVALLAARRKVNHGGADVWNDGDDGRGAVLVSNQAHYCVDRAVRIMGWGAEGVGLVDTDDQHRITPSGLETAMQDMNKKGRRVVAVVGSSCTTSSGAFDDLELVADFAEQHGLWFHVDGAHGAPAAFSARHKHLLSGMERADSVAMDFHKIMGLPALCTGLFFRQQEMSFLPFTQSAEYLWSDAEDPEWWNFGKRTFECTKRMLSTRVAAVLEEYGPEIWGVLVDRLFGLGKELAERIEARSGGGWQLAMEPEGNIVCFRYLPRDFKDTNAENAFTQLLRQRHLEEGPQYMVQTRFDGKVWLRCTLMNPLTEPQDMAGLLDRIEELAQEL
ncbi:MAG: pyridoxal-dependent decarboxylase [Flavobacteriales bacterium]|nr:pyridoxal-dependent decarboxylase [Flavobacteriales bacterium]